MEVIKCVSTIRWYEGDNDQIFKLTLCALFSFMKLFESLWRELRCLAENIYSKLSELYKTNNETKNNLRFPVHAALLMISENLQQKCNSTKQKIDGFLPSNYEVFGVGVEGFDQLDFG